MRRAGSRLEPGGRGDRSRRDGGWRGERCGCPAVTTTIAARERSDDPGSGRSSEWVI